MTHSWFPWSQEPAGDKLCQLSMTTENIHGVLSENCVDVLLEHRNFVPGPTLGGQAQGAEGTCMQADAFPRSSSARNPIVIVKICIFIFLLLKVVLQANPCKGGRCNLEGWSRHLHVPQAQKNYIYPHAGGAIT